MSRTVVQQKCHLIAYSLDIVSFPFFLIGVYKPSCDSLSFCFIPNIIRFTIVLSSRLEKLYEMLDVANVVKVTSSGLIGASALAGALAATGASAKTGGVIGFSVGIISALFIGKSIKNLIH
jgi:hypothetical protein